MAPSDPQQIVVHAPVCTGGAHLMVCHTCKIVPATTFDRKILASSQKSGKQGYHDDFSH